MRYSQTPLKKNWKETTLLCLTIIRHGTNLLPNKIMTLRRILFFKWEKLFPKKINNYPKRRWCRGHQELNQILRLSLRVALLRSLVWLSSSSSKEMLSLLVWNMKKLLTVTWDACQVFLSLIMHWELLCWVTDLNAILNLKNMNLLSRMLTWHLRMILIILSLFKEEELLLTTHKDLDKPEKISYILYH